MTLALSTGFWRSSELFPGRPALDFGSASYSYAELRELACAIASTLYDRAASEPSLTAIYAHRSLSAFAGVLGTLLRGHGYVPLGPNFPSARSRAMLQRSGARAIIVDRTSESALADLLQGVDESTVLVFPEHRNASELSAKYDGHEVYCHDDFSSSGSWQPVEVKDEDIAYILFTSGSTGTPKGVIVTHGNVVSFVSHILERYALGELDRLSQTFSLTFDLSVFDMFVSWSCGACLCCPSEKALFKPGKYIRESELSVWFSVPTTVAIMKKFGELKEGAYPNLRLSLFCGEALPVEVVKQWATAAPNSVIENIYGPTELTIACTEYRWKGDQSDAESENGIVPIGAPYPNMKALVLDDALLEVPINCEGELVMTGPQLSKGYLNDPENTSQAFVVPPGQTQIYYRTGDRVRRPEGDRPLIYLGRVDQQIKIRGHRVELNEIEHVMRTIAEVDTAVAVGWPVTSSGADGITAFMDPCEMDVATMRARVREQLPDYMVPREILFVDNFPRNSSGKVDRRALIRKLEKSK